jgi:hypothetical protein
VLDSVPKGYVYYCCGTCAPKKLRKLAEKFHAQYGIGCSPAQRITRKKKGLANSILVAYWPQAVDEPVAGPVSDVDAAANAGEATEFASFESLRRVAAEDAIIVAASPITLQAALTPTGVVGVADSVVDSVVGSIANSGNRVDALSVTNTFTHSDTRSATNQSDAISDFDSHAEAQIRWLLLATAGAGPVHELETLRSVLETPRLVFLGYELVRHSVRRKTSWTFRRTKSEMSNLYALLDDQLKQRHQEGRVAQTLLRISRQPGFSGIRQQSWDLYQFARLHGYAGELPFLYFVQKLRHGTPLILG